MRTQKFLAQSGLTNPIPELLDQIKNLFFPDKPNLIPIPVKSGNNGKNRPRGK